MQRHEKALALLAEGTVIPAMPLVLDQERQFDEAGQRRLIRYYLASGVGGLAVGVHTTQFEIRDPEFNLFEQVLRLAADEISLFEKKHNQTIIKMAGACGPASQAVAETKLAASLGYDAVLLSPGGLAGASEKELIERTAAVGQHLPVVAFYLQPAVGGRILPFDYWRQIFELESVVAVKCAAFNRYQTLDVMRAVALSSRRDQIALYTGNDDNIFADLMTSYSVLADGVSYNCRFVGGLLGHWAVWTKTTVDLFTQLKKDLAAQKDLAPWLDLAAQVTDSNSAVFDVAHNFAGCITGVHEVLRRQGLMPGIWTLKADEDLSPGQAEEISRVIRQYPHLVDDDFVKIFLAADESC